ncbi:MAG: hypothetical protein KGL90_11270 [Burkholderiales bacterium]|nr:hypothetical protein [Burkholderiales bacterium]
MRLISAAISVLITLGLAACASTAHERYAGAVIPVGEGSVASCNYLGTLTSTSGLFGFFAPKGVDDLKQDLLRQADVLGASHVVWSRPNVGYSGTSLTAMAYRCPAP